MNTKCNFLLGKVAGKLSINASSFIFKLYNCHLLIFTLLHQYVCARHYSVQLSDEGVATEEIERVEVPHCFCSVFVCFLKQRHDCAGRLQTIRSLAISTHPSSS